MLVQIYGITVPEDARLVDGIGPDLVGVVLDEGIPTWDSVDRPTLDAIREELTRVRVVALSLSTEPARILDTAAAARPDVVHLARAHLMSEEALAAVRSGVGPAELMLTVPVSAGAEELASRLARSADYLLLDTAHPETGVVGATGLVHDWSQSAAVVASVGCPVVLAGGLGPHNVVDAIRAVRPAGVDSETRTSRPDDRRRKDPEAVRRFVELARAAGGG